VTEPGPAGTAGFRWPDGAQCAVAFTFDVDAESPLLAIRPDFADRMSTMSQQAYGPEAGVPRLLRILGQHRVRSTFFVPGYTARRYPDPVRAIVAAGHEIAHHGYLHEPLAGKSLAEETALLDLGLAALSEIAGVTPVGYRAPFWEANWHTPDLLAERGFLYDSSLMNSDYPYELAAGDGSLVELPITWALDDWGQYCYVPEFSGNGMIADPDAICALWRADFEAMRAAGGLWILTNHPFLSGRPARARALGDLIAHVAHQPGVWIATLAEIATHIRGLGLPRRQLSKPVL
jgi:peptidoglycan/xylan/chitin deacetylase (PgdA/CDA1 family)